MRHLWHIALREITERRLALVVALLLGLASPLAARALRVDLLTASLIFAVGISHAVALLVGANTVNRALREDRFGFFLNRPVGQGAIWWGKLLGTVLLAACTGAVALAPGFLVSLALARDVSDARTVLAGSTALLLVSALLGHVFSAMAGARSKRALLDLLALLVVAAIAWASFDRLTQVFPHTGAAARWVAVLLGGALVVGGLLGGWRQVAVGRTDRAGGHRALSTSVWGATMLAALVSAGFVSWTLHVDPRAMSVVSFDAGSDSPWFVAHHARRLPELHPRAHLRAQILTHAESGRWHLLDRETGPLPARVARDGSRVIWTRRRVGRRGAVTYTAWTAPLEGQSMGDRMRIPLPGGEDPGAIYRWELSPDGRRIVDVTTSEDVQGRHLGLRFRVWDVETARVRVEEWLETPLIATRWVPWMRLFWDADGEIRTFFDDGTGLVLVSLDPVGGALRREAKVDAAPQDWMRVRSGPREDRRFGGATHVRFSSGGGQILIAYEPPETGDLPVSADADASLEDPVLQGEAPVRFELYDGRLSTLLWELPPLPVKWRALELVGDSVVVRTWSEGEGPGTFVGGAQGWSEKLPPAWQPLGWLDEGRTLGVQSFFEGPALLDVQTGALSSLDGEAKAALFMRYPLLQMRDFDLIGLASFWGGELEHPSTASLYSTLGRSPGDEIQEHGHFAHESVVRWSAESELAVPLYSE